MLEIFHYMIIFDHSNDNDLYKLMTEFSEKCCNLVNFLFYWKGDWICIIHESWLQMYVLYAHMQCSWQLDLWCCPCEVG